MGQVKNSLPGTSSARYFNLALQDQ